MPVLLGPLLVFSLKKFDVIYDNLLKGKCAIMNLLKKTLKPSLFMFTYAETCYLNTAGKDFVSK